MPNLFDTSQRSHKPQHGNYYYNSSKNQEVFGEQQFLLNAVFGKLYSRMAFNSGGIGQDQKTQWILELQKG